MSTRRLFFALWPDEAMREGLAAAVAGALRAVRGGRPVPVANLHVTLAFLGSVPEASLARLVELVRQLRDAGELSGATIDMRLDRIEHWRQAEILCAAASRMPARAEELAGALRTALIGADFRPDLKPFRAHVTLARHVRRVPRDLGMPEVRWTFEEFALVESRTLPEGSSYSIVDSWALCGEAPRRPRAAPGRPDAR